MCPIPDIPLKGENIIISFQIKRFKSSYLKIYTLLNSYSFKFLVNILNYRKSIQDLRGQNPCKNVGLV